MSTALNRSTTKLPVAIIGNGVGAFTSALSLHRAGVRNKIFIAESKLTQTARQAIFIGGSAVRILDRLGLGSDYRAFGSPVHHVQVRDKNERDLMNFKLDGMGTEAWAVPKDHLLQSFLEAIPPESVQFNSKLRSMRYTKAGVQINLSQIQDHTGILTPPLQKFVDTDFIIGADGTTSTVRMFMSRATMTMPSGVTVWRSIVHHLNLNEIPFHVAQEMWDGNRRFGYVRVTHDEVMWWAIITTTNQEIVDSTILRPFLPRLYRMFNDFPKIVEKLIFSVDSDRHIERKQVKRVWPKHSPWIDRSSWRVALVGDARRPGTAETFHTSHSFAVDDGYILANVIVNQNSRKNEVEEMDKHPLDMYDENREKNLQVTRELSRHARTLAKARSFPQRYIGKAFLNHAIHRMTDQSMSSILPTSSLLNL